MRERDWRYPRFYRTDRRKGREHIVYDDDECASASEIGGDARHPTVRW
jgi:hypothetical protein